MILWSRLRTAEVAGIDARVLRDVIKRLIDRGWAKPIIGTKNVLLKSINKEFEYKLLPNGKADKKRNKKYFRVRVFKNYTLKKIKALVRGLLCKSFYQKQIYSQLSKDKLERFSKKEIKSLNIRAKHFGYKVGSVAPTAVVPIGIRLLAKMMGVSRSTADRTIKLLADAKLIHRKVGFTWQRGIKEKLLKPDNLPYGVFLHNGIAYKKDVNCYAF